jgi:undecaprenyl pyrophosphate phosphatase UppP
MLKNTLNNFQKKSLKERFLLVIGILFFLVYLILGLIIIFWDMCFLKPFPIAMQPIYRMAFGVILIVYSFLRFFRFFNSNND